MSLIDFFENAAKLIEAFEVGYNAGHELNEHVVQDYLDEQHAGSGALGESYVDFIEQHGDPAPAVEFVQHLLDTAFLHHEDHQQHDAASQDHN